MEIRCDPWNVEVRFYSLYVTLFAVQNIYPATEDDSDPWIWIC